MIAADLLVLAGFWAAICLLFAGVAAICDPGGLYDRVVDWLDARRSSSSLGGHLLSRCVRVHPDPAPSSPVRPGSGSPRPGPVVSTGFPPFPDGRPVPDNPHGVHA